MASQRQILEDFLELIQTRSFNIVVSHHQPSHATSIIPPIPTAISIIISPYSISPPTVLIIHGIPRTTSKSLDFLHYRGPRATTILGSFPQPVALSSRGAKIVGQLLLHSLQHHYLYQTQRLGPHAFHAIHTRLFPYLAVLGPSAFEHACGVACL
ncbi:hypothetical protein BD779DRAFT_229150 [Infundibulicybe gibba]|nr:hypothetical protein BD779DRAFT_229150 [Infundibulicybe gibba]